MQVLWHENVLLKHYFSAHTENKLEGTLILLLRLNTVPNTDIKKPNF